VNEAETRAEHIDPALKAAGWGVVEGSRILREYKISPGPNRGSGQAKAYAQKLSVRFTYATNGQGIYGIDMECGEESEVSAYPGPEALWERNFGAKSEWRNNFAAVPFEDRGGFFQGRYYQDIAVERVLEAMAGRKQRILLTLATGTGKTFIAFQIAWKLFHSRWNLTGEPTRRPRILFLADRNILANEAYNAFSAFPEDALVRIESSEIAKKGRVPKNGNLFFTIFQTFMSGPGDTPYFGEYPPDFFDFIVIDECHRGGANDEGSWRGILEHFDPAVQLGLTATPKRRDNVDTYAYFGEPVFSYSLKDGINDGYLTPFRVRQIQTTMPSTSRHPFGMMRRGWGEVTATIAALAAEDRGVIHLKAFDLPVQEEQLVITAAGIRALGEVLARGYLEGR
jgi:type I restriction enzyme, R subunit